jgi:catechol 2,3-dioxygenase-like lactoylglutathione lyase family enzyme
VINVPISHAAPPITGVDHIGIRVGDLDEAVTFFVTCLGWVQTLRGVAPDGITPMAFVALGPVEIELFESLGVTGAVLDHIALRTDDLGDARRQLEQRGVRPLGDEREGARGQAQRLEAESTLGLSFHLSKR